MGVGRWELGICFLAMAKPLIVRGGPWGRLFGTVVPVAGLLVAALGMRLVNLGAYTGKFDEGIRAEQLLLMRAGFRPVSEIFAAQGPLSLDIFYGPYLLFGETLAAARAGVVLYSLLGILATFWVGGLVAGRLSGTLAAGLLVLSPLYLKNSRLALLEVPALVPATLSLGAALLFQARGKRRWLLFSAAMFALAVLIKPIVIGVLAPIGLAMLLRRNRNLLDFVLFGVVAAVLALTVVALYGTEQVWQQIVGYRVSASQSTRWSLRENWSILSQELADEQLPIYVLAIVGGIFVSASQPRWGLPLAAWPLANLILLLVYSPLQFKHAVILLPPIALVIGTALTTMWRQSNVRRPTSDVHRPSSIVQRPTRIVALALMGWYLISLPAVLRQDWSVMSAATETRVETYADETRLVSELTQADDFIISDDPILAFNSDRKVPPSLVDPSSYRVRSRALSGAEVVQASQDYDVKLLFLFSDGLRELKSFEDYVEHRYRAVKIYERLNAKDRTLYLRDDADLAAARTVLERDIERPLRVDFGDELRLLGYTLARDDPRAGSSVNLTLHWEALRRMTVDYHVITHLRGANGQGHFQSERGLGGGGLGTAAWEAGQWVFRSQALPIPARTTPGNYQLSVALYDSRSRTSPPVSLGDGIGSIEQPLGQVRVR
jgi:hypothetical protein